MRQLSRVSLTPHDGFEDGYPGLAGDVADDLVQLHVHLGQRLLHVLNMLGRIFHQHGPLPQIASQPPDAGLGPESRRKQAVGM